MIILAIAATLGAIIWTLFVMFANGMRSSPGKFVGLASIVGWWLATTVFWLAWGFS